MGLGHICPHWGLKVQPEEVACSYSSLFKKQKQSRGSRLTAENSSKCPATPQWGGRVQQLWRWLWHRPGRWRLCVSALHSCEDDGHWGQHQSDWGAGAGSVHEPAPGSGKWSLAFCFHLKGREQENVTVPCSHVWCSRHSIEWLRSALTLEVLRAVLLWVVVNSTTPGALRVSCPLDVCFFPQWTLGLQGWDLPLNSPVGMSPVQFNLLTS